MGHCDPNPDPRFHTKFDSVFPISHAAALVSQSRAAYNFSKCDAVAGLYDAKKRAPGRVALTKLQIHSRDSVEASQCTIRLTLVAEDMVRLHGSDKVGFLANLTAFCDKEKKK